MKFEKNSYCVKTPAMYPNHDWVFFVIIFRRQFRCVDIKIQAIFITSQIISHWRTLHAYVTVFMCEFGTIPGVGWLRGLQIRDHRCTLNIDIRLIRGYCRTVGSK